MLAVQVKESKSQEFGKLGVIQFIASCALKWTAEKQEGGWKLQKNRQAFEELVASLDGQPIAALPAEKTEGKLFKGSAVDRNANKQTKWLQTILHQQLSSPAAELALMEFLGLLQHPALLEVASGWKKWTRTADTPTTRTR